ncbi:hypothetical protein AB0K09_20095 [Streptomyces sp. NPDC049577]|uniref:hypothetical protein n=1 Tax=Streptomyces sp. NPDC049577 TaxID=3155153 RepID=UPI003415B1B7
MRRRPALLALTGAAALAGLVPASAGATGRPVPVPVLLGPVVSPGGHPVHHRFAPLLGPVGPALLPPVRGVPSSPGRGWPR